MRLYRLTTPYGATYYIHEQGRIERGDMPDMRPSDDWRLIGLARTGPGYAFGSRVCSFEQLADRLDSLQFRYKNGRPRYTVIDFDHGSARVWGNTSYHGVASIERMA